MATVDLRALTRADFGLLSTWLTEPEVVEWWHDDPAPAALERQYGASIDGLDPTTVLVASHEGRPVGLVQWYRWADEPDYLQEVAGVVTVPAGAAGIDYLIGSPDSRGRGLGRAMITAVLARVAAAGLMTVIVPVHVDNHASRAVLRRCGFVVVADAELDPDNPDHDRRHVIYRLDQHATKE